jgi:hypothetical protein
VSDTAYSLIEHNAAGSTAKSSALLHVRIDEINRSAAHSCLTRSPWGSRQKPITAESAFWGAGGQYGSNAKRSDGERVHFIIAALDTRKSKSSNREDALIAEVAMVNGYGLITSDCILSEVMKVYGVTVIFVGRTTSVRRRNPGNGGPT